jgi:hypothetical protein
MGFVKSGKEIQRKRGVQVEGAGLREHAFSFSVAFKTYPWGGQT